jgi:hypothetical protein
MTRRGLILCGLSIGLLASGARAHAGPAKDAVQISVQVVRSCKVQASVAGAAVDCGRRASGPDAAPRSPTAIARTVNSSSAPAITTINF